MHIWRKSTLAWKHTFQDEEYENRNSAKKRLREQNDKKPFSPVSRMGRKSNNQIFQLKYPLKIPQHYNIVFHMEF